MKYRWAIATAAATMGSALAAQAPQPAQPRAPQQAQAQAQPVQIPTRASAAMLTRLCEGDRAACLGYVIGVVDAYSAALVASGRPLAFCVPAGTTNDQIAQTIVTYLRAHPQEGQSNAASVVMAGLSMSYRCGY
jgi:hypothetical protein